MQAFGLADLIRVNQLVRHRIDFEGFEAWYRSLPPEQRRALTYLLCEFAYQAGVSECVWEEALVASGLPAGDPTVQWVLDSRQGTHPLFGLYQTLHGLPETELPKAFRLFVFLFGTVEGRVYRGESKGWCNHWWHRDLLDERVVRDLLSDPHFYRTAMKDDDRIKGTA